jgi:hypothetical protein
MTPLSPPFRTLVVASAFVLLALPAQAKPSLSDKAIQEDVQAQASAIRRNTAVLNAMGLKFIGASYLPRNNTAKFTFKLKPGITRETARAKLASAAKAQTAAFCRGVRSLLERGLYMTITVLDSTGRHFGSFAFTRKSCG